MKSDPLQLTPEVIDALNEELAYTSTLPAQGRADKEDYGVEGQLLTLGTYARLAHDAWVMNPGPDQALDGLRKVAAIAIRGLLVSGRPIPRRIKP